MPNDKFPGRMLGGLDSPAEGGQNVTPGEALDFVTRALWVGTGGNLVLTMKRDDEGDAEVIVKNVADGTLLPFRVKAVLTETSDSPTTATTTASDIVALW